MDFEGNNKENILRSFGMGQQVNRAKAGYCPTCSEPINMADFKDALSKREFEIGGMCQACQDMVFG